MFGKRTPYIDKTPLQLLEIELKRLHGLLNHSYHQGQAFGQIKLIHNHLLELHKEQALKLVPERIKSMEDTIAELMLMGKEDKK